MSNPFVQTVKHHWKTNFPKEATELEQAGELDREAEAAAERAGRVHEEAKAKGLSWSQAEELATEQWGKPPNS
jgi:hypothetical protein